MTQIFVGIPLMRIEQRIESPSVVREILIKIRQLIGKIHPQLLVQDIYWTQFNLNPNNSSHE